MRKIGREVCFLETTENHRRKGEGAFIRLKNGNILFAYTEYNAGYLDGDKSGICAITSCDEGETWQEKRVLLTPDEGALNYMSVSFMRLQSGDIGMFFLRKDKISGSCRLHLSCSSDEGETWSKPVCCLEAEGDTYNVVNNDRVLRLKSGRLLVPEGRHELKKAAPESPQDESLKVAGVQLSNLSRLNLIASDDDGRTWKTLTAQPIPIPFEERSSTGLQEPGVYQYEDGTIWAWARTGFGSQYSLYSKDEGVTWTTPAPSEFFTAPAAPMQVKKVGKYTLAVWNPAPNYTTRTDLYTRSWGRTPFVCAVSTDDGRTFPKVFFIENDPENGYCYPAILEGKDYFLLAYYHSNGDPTFCLNCCKIIKVMYDELEAEAD